MKKIMIICLTFALTLTMLTACTQNQSGSQQDGQTAQEEQTQQPDLQEIVQAVKDAYGDNYLPSMQMDEQMMTDVYGVDMDNVEEFVAEGPMISAHVDTFIAVKAKEGKGEQVQQELQAYLDYVQENALQYPMNTAKVQAAQVVRHGDYVFYVLLGGYDERTDVTEEERHLCQGAGSDWPGRDRFLLLIRGCSLQGCSWNRKNEWKKAAFR